MLLEYGAITVMFPIALVIAGWLWLSGTRAACAVWLLTVLCAYALVGASKILFKGWGIGLPFVKAVGESHGGSVSVDSSPELGTTFLIDIPVDCRPFVGDSAQCEASA